MKFLGINLTKGVQDLHTESNKMLLRVIKDDTEK